MGTIAKLASNNRKVDFFSDFFFISSDYY